MNARVRKKSPGTNTPGVLSGCLYGDLARCGSSGSVLDSDPWPERDLALTATFFVTGIREGEAVGRLPARGFSKRIAGWEHQRLAAGWPRFAAVSTQRDDDDFDWWVTEKGGPDAVVAMVDDMKRRVAAGSLTAFRDKEALLLGRWST